MTDDELFERSEKSLTRMITITEKVMMLGGAELGVFYQNISFDLATRTLLRKRTKSSNTQEGK